MNEAFSLGFALVLLIIVCVIFVRISRKARRGGAGSAAGTLGALYDLHSKDQRRAIETIVDVNAGKKQQEQESSDSSP